MDKNNQNLIAGQPGTFNVPSTVPLSATSTTAFNTPPVSNPNTAVTSALSPYIAQFQKQADASTQQQGTEQNTYTNLLSQLGNQSADAQQAEGQLGLPGLQNDVRDLRTLQSQQLGSYIGQINAQELNANGVTRTAQSGNEAAITRQHGIDALVTSSLIQAKEGNIASAQATVDRAVALKYDPIKAKIEAQKFVLDQVNTKAAEDRKTALNLQLKQIDKKAEEETAVQNMLIDASAQQAPASVIKTANEIIKNGGTPAQVAQALGQYTGVAAKAELLREQIKTEKAQQSNYYASASKTRSEIGTSGGKPPTDTQITNSGYATRIEQANNIIDANAETFAKMGYSTFKLLESNSPIANTLLKPEERQVAQAMRNFITAKLRKESGASISPSEFEDARSIYFPSLKDDETTLANKKKLRDSVLQNSIQSSGSSYSPSPQVDTNNPFSQAISTNKFQGTSILAPSSSGSFNFIIPK